MHPISARVSARARERDGLRPLPTAAAPVRDAVQVGDDRAPRRVARGYQEGGRTRDSRDRRDRSSDKASEVARRTPQAGLRRVRTAGRVPECQARSPTVAGCEPAGPRTARCRIRRPTEPDGDAPCHEPAGPRTARSRTAPPRTRRPKEPGGDVPGHRIAGQSRRGAGGGLHGTGPDDERGGEPAATCTNQPPVGDVPHQPPPGDTPHQLLSVTPGGSPARAISRNRNRDRPEARR